MYTFTTKVLDKIEYAPGARTGRKIGVFRVEGEDEEQIGEYERNYPLPFNTFYHFTKHNKDYALYSPHYTATRVMQLPACKDIGGEEPDDWGFCPVDYYVPSYIHREYLDAQDKAHHYQVYEPTPEDLATRNVKWNAFDKNTGELINIEKSSYPISPVKFFSFGFVAGQVWKDNGSWKIQFLDLTQADKGIIKREELFGYIAMPEQMTLKQAIEIIDNHEENGAIIRIATKPQVQGPIYPFGFYSRPGPPDKSLWQRQLLELTYDFSEEEEIIFMTMALQRRFDLPTGKS